MSRWAGRQARLLDVLATKGSRTRRRAEVLSVVGDHVTRIALAVLVFQQTLSAAWTALAYVATCVPAFLRGVFRGQASGPALITPRAAPRSGSGTPPRRTPATPCPPPRSRRERRRLGWLRARGGNRGPQGGTEFVQSGRQGERRSRAISHWAIWALPRRVTVFLLAVEGITAVLTVIMVAHSEVDGPALVTFGCVAGLGLVIGEITRHVERARRRFDDTPHINLTSVWTLAAALLLPPPLTVLVVVLLYQHLFWRSWAHVAGVHAYRLVYSACTVILAASASGEICRVLGFTPSDLSAWREPGSVGVVLAAILAYSIVNSGLVEAAIVLSDGGFDVRRVLGTTRENALEYGTLGLGATGALLLTLYPAWVLLMVPALLVLHRSVLMRQLEEAASTDPKTGLANPAGWTNIANRELDRATRDGGTVGVLMVDLDHFKKINDTHGHLVGDQVLKAVAQTLAKAVRRHDLVGRWGGEEFAVLCPDVSGAELVRIADRVCDLVRHLDVPVSLAGDHLVVDHLTVSVGAARYPESGPTLQDILLAADGCLFAAKNNGRDQVQSGRTPVDERDHAIRP